MKTWTINEIQTAMRVRGSHWWDAGTMRFFGTRVSEQVYQGPGGIYFVTSEKPPHGSRAFAVRQFFPANAGIETIGELASMSRAQAHRLAAKMAATTLQSQFNVAMLELDRAVTGSILPDYGFVEDAKSGKPVPLACHEHTACVAKTYDDGSGIYLELAASDRVDRSKAWSDAYKLQREVCRVLQTEPAGESAIVAAEAHKPVSDADDFALMMHRECGMARESADELRRLARKHHKLSEDWCNYGGDEVQAKRDRVESRISKLCKQFNASPIFQGDPRGATVKIQVPSGYTNDFGKEGIVVPTL